MTELDSWEKKVMIHKITGSKKGKSKSVIEIFFERKAESEDCPCGNI